MIRDDKDKLFALIDDIPKIDTFSEMKSFTFPRYLIRLWRLICYEAHDSLWPKSQQGRTCTETTCEDHEAYSHGKKDLIHTEDQ